MKRSQKAILLILLFAFLFGIMGIQTGATMEPEQQLLENLPNCINPQKASTAQHVSILEEFETNPNILGYKNLDGTNTVYIYNKPVKYKAANGTMQIIDNDIIPIANLALGQEGYFYENKANSVKTYFSGQANAQKGTKLEYDNYTLDIAPNVNSQSSNELVLFNRSANTNTPIRYQDVFNDKTDVAHEITATGFQEKIILEEYTGQNTFQYIIDSHGLEPEVAADSNVEFYAAGSDEPVFVINQPMVTDSSPQQKVSADNTVSITPVAGQEDQYVYTVTLDEEFLADENTVYPLSSEGEVYQAANSYIEDTYVSTLMPSVNHSTLYNLNVGHNQYLGESTTLVKFNLQGLSHNIEVISADYDIYNSSTDSSILYIYIKAMQQAWNASTITSAQFQSFTTTPKNYYTYHVFDGWNSFDLTQMVQDWLIYDRTGEGQPNYGLLMEQTVDYSPLKGFYSSESPTNPSSLSITYRPAPSGVRYYLKNANSNYYLDIGDDDWLVQKAYTGKLSQQWTLVEQSDGNYIFLSPQYTNSKMMRISNTSNSAADVYDYTSTSYPYTFKLSPNTDGTYNIYCLKPNDYVYSGLDIASSSTAVNAQAVFNSASTANSQKWYLEPVGLESGRTYFIKNTNSGHFLDVESGTNSNVSQYQFHGYANQRWTATATSNGYFILSGKNPSNQLRNLYLDTSDNNNIRGMSGQTGVYAQWKPVSNGDGSFRLVNRGSGLCATVTSSSTALSANVRGSAYNGSNGQRFYFEERLYSITINPYYDNGFKQRYSSASSAVSGWMDWVSGVLWDDFSIDVTSGLPIKYTSISDNCCTVTASSINEQCNHLASGSTCNATSGHHKNAYRNVSYLRQIPGQPVTKVGTIPLGFSGHVNCNGGCTSNSSIQNFTANGLTDYLFDGANRRPSTQKSGASYVVCVNGLYSYSDFCRSVAMHELGHALAFGQDSVKVDTTHDNCFMSKSRTHSTIVAAPVWCDECRKAINRQVHATSYQF